MCIYTSYREKTEKKSHLRTTAVKPSKIKAFSGANTGRTKSHQSHLLEMIFIDRIKEVKERVNLKNIIQDAGMHFKNNMACCPFHNEKTPSFSVKGERYKCFSCGEGGDVIDFVSKYYNISPLDAARKIDSDYNLGIFRELTEKEKRDIKTQVDIRKKEKEQKEEFEFIRDRIYLKRCDEYRIQRKIMQLSDPEIYGINKFYIEAYNKAQALEHWFEEERLYVYDK